jgi:hypothetical protein
LQKGISGRSKPAQPLSARETELAALVIPNPNYLLPFLPGMSDNKFLYP